MVKSQFTGCIFLTAEHKPITSTVT